MAPNWKPERGTAKAERRARKWKRDVEERKAKARVRARDRVCRFPQCLCRKRPGLLHVSHQVHKGMGGNPAGDRSVPELMLLLCGRRHRESVLSIDRGTIKWEALTPAGADGPIRWLIAADAIALPMAGWFEIAREVSPGVIEPMTAEQKSAIKTILSLDK